MLSVTLVASVCWCSSCCVSPTSSISSRARRSSKVSKRPAMSSRLGLVILSSSSSGIDSQHLALGTEARSPGLPDLSEQVCCHHVLAVRTRIGFHGLNHHAPGKGWNGLEALARRVFPAQFLGDIEAEGLRSR